MYDCISIFICWSCHDDDLFDDHDDDNDNDDDNLTSRAHHIGSYSWRGEKIVHCA